MTGRTFLSILTVVTLNDADCMRFSSVLMLIIINKKTHKASLPPDDFPAAENENERLHCVYLLSLKGVSSVSIL